MSPALNGSSEILHFEHSDVIEKRDGIIFDFCTGRTQASSQTFSRRRGEKSPQLQDKVWEGGLGTRLHRSTTYVTVHYMINAISTIIEGLNCSDSSCDLIDRKMNDN